MAQDPSCHRRIYLDHAATTPLRPEARAAMAPYFAECFGNPGSLHAEGRRAREALEAARDSIRRACGASGFDLVFVSGGTEANNLALLGPLLAAGRGGGVSGRLRLIVSAVEHASILEVEPVAAALGAEWMVCQCTREGRIDLDRLSALATDRTLGLSVQWANNETGALQPLTEVMRLARKSGAWLHTDAVQALGKVPLDLDSLEIDLMTISAHKVGGPRGIAGLFLRKGLAFRSILRGGAQESGRRAGTENVAQAVGFACAVELAHAERIEAMAGLQNVRDRLLDAIAQRWPRRVINTPAQDRLPNVLNASFPWVEGESLVRLLDWHGIAASTGSACNVGAQKPSHVLRAMGSSDREIRGSLRLSLGQGNTVGDVEPTCQALAQALSQLEQLSPG